MVENYRHLYVIIELEDEKFLPVSFEMLGEARRLLDDFNKKYSTKEKVVAVVLGYNIKNISKQLIEYGADAVIFSDSPELKDVRNTIYTKVISQIAQDIKTLAEVEQIRLPFLVLMNLVLLVQRHLESYYILVDDNLACTPDYDYQDKE